MGKDVGGDRAVHALDLALGLGVVGAPVARGDCQAQQPGRQGGEAAAAAGAPGRAVVGQDRPGRPGAAEAGGQVRLAHLLLLAGAGDKGEQEAGMVVEDGQRVPR